MASTNRYFTIPFQHVSENPAYPVWYVTWSTERPVVAPGVDPPLVVGATAEEALPEGATLLGTGSKDPPPPPPPPSVMAISQPEYEKAVLGWLDVSRGEDE